MMIDYKLVVLGICFMFVNIYTSTKLMASSPAHPLAASLPPVINLSCQCAPPPCPSFSCPASQPCNNYPSNQQYSIQGGEESVVASMKRDEEYAKANPDTVLRVPLRYGITTNIKLQVSWADAWWREKLPQWEDATFMWFHRLIRPTTTYLGFGEWMGPTILFAARHGKRAMGLEPDPVAYGFLKNNVASNPSLKGKVKVFQRCISSTWEAVTMYGAGGSGSFLIKNDTNKDVNSDHLKYMEKYPTNKFTVHCLPLWEFLDDQDAMTDDLFIKMDVEGAERFIIPSYIKWLSEYPHPHKPAFFISMHVFQDFTPEQKADIYKVVRMYKYFGYPLSKEDGVVLRSTSSFEEITIPEIFLTDRSLDEYPTPTDYY